MRVLTLPAYFPDSSPIKSIWRYLARVVYENGRLHDSVSLVNDQISSAWAEIESTTIDSHNKLMPTRRLCVIQ